MSNRRENPRAAVVRIGNVEAILADGPVSFIDTGQSAPSGIDIFRRLSFL